MLTTYLEAVRQGLWEEMERDPDVFMMGEDIGTYGGAFKVTAGMLERFGENRVVDTPLSEAAIVAAGIGAALTGLRPVVEMQFADFISCAFDQIVNFAAKTRYRWGPAVPMVIRGPSGGGFTAAPSTPKTPRCRSSTPRASRWPCPPPLTTPRVSSRPLSGTTTRCCSSSTSCSTAASKRICPPKTT